MNTLKRNLTLLSFLATLTVALAACSSSPISVEGSWSGVLAPTGETPADIVIDLQQDGTSLQGLLTNQTDDLATLVEGSINGEVVNLEAADTTGTATFIGNVDGDSMSGNFEVLDTDGKVVFAGSFSVERN